MPDNSSTTAALPDADALAEYVRGALSEEAARRVEIALFEHPELVREAEFEQLLRHGLTTARLDVAPGDGSLRRRLAWMRGALAASAAVIVGLGVWNVDQGRRLAEQARPVAEVPVMTLHDQRALFAPDSSPDVLADRAAPLLLEIDVSAHDFEAYEVEIFGSRRKFRFERVRPGERGYLTVYLPAAQAIERVAVRDMQGRAVNEFEFDSFASGAVPEAPDH